MIGMNVESREPVIAYRGAKKKKITIAQISGSEQRVNPVMFVDLAVELVRNIILAITAGDGKRTCGAIACSRHVADPGYIIDIVLLIAPRIDGKTPFLSNLLMRPDHKTAVQLVKVDLILGKRSSMSPIGTG